MHMYEYDIYMYVPALLLPPPPDTDNFDPLGIQSPSSDPSLDGYKKETLTLGMDERVYH